MRSLTTSLMSQYIQLIPPPAHDAQMLSRWPLYGALLPSHCTLEARKEASAPLVKIFVFIVLQLFFLEQRAPCLHCTRWTTWGLI